jgi:periplasmic copper chaperone A
VEFKPGGYHIMFMDLVGTPTAGQSVDLTLTFANAGPITVKAEVRAQ